MSFACDGRKDLGHVLPTTTTENGKNFFQARTRGQQEIHVTHCRGRACTGENNYIRVRVECSTRRRRDISHHTDSLILSRLSQEEPRFELPEFQLPESVKEISPAGTRYIRGRPVNFFR
ncbi:unnamed protein product [Cyprideis torosa]|uniref:Uncharacterized protein n=1 Tax=Cyprideis torosa TaxID=163714 RepID=A0A7R8ZHE5_9CRUS|nr:unnamed protein product [Cyprideis torosa]CAG0882362.1 unnamed protein product [Cyprideis torosa]